LIANTLYRTPAALTAKVTMHRLKKLREEVVAESKKPAAKQQEAI